MKTNSFATNTCPNMVPVASAPSDLSRRTQWCTRSARRMFGDVKAGPPRATPDLSYILSRPLLDRALLRAQLVFN
jgi:hypothetical protein